MESKKGKAIKHCAFDPRGFDTYSYNYRQSFASTMRIDNVLKGQTMYDDFHEGWWGYTQTCVYFLWLG